MSQERILLVGDNPTAARDLARQLESLGYALLPDLANWKDAAESVERWRPDLVLIVLGTENLADGIQAAQAIRNHRITPIVFLAAASADLPRPGEALGGPFCWLLQPLAGSDLRTAIEASLRRPATESGPEGDRVDLAAILCTAMDGFWMTDAETHFLEVNEHFCSMIGYSREELLRMSVHDLAADETPAEVASTIGRVMRDGSARFESRHRAKSGQLADVEVTVGFLAASGGRLLGFVRDITERKRTQAEREVAARLLGLVNCEGDLHDLIQGVTLLLREFSGCEAVGIRLRDGDDFPYAETRGFPARFVQAENFLCHRDSAGGPALECLCGQVLGGRIGGKRSFYTARGSFWTNSSTAWLASLAEADRPAYFRNRCNREGYESIALVPLRGGSGICGLLQMTDRRTDRFSVERLAQLERLADLVTTAIVQRQAQEALRRNERKFRSYVEHAPFGIFTFDRTGRCLEQNARGARFLGYTEEEMGSLTVRRILTRESYEAAVPLYATLVREGFADGELQLRRKDGTEFWASLRAVKLDDRRFIVFQEDITTRKQAELAVRESEARFRMLVENAPDAIYVRVDGRIVYLNSAAVALFGAQSADQLIGQSVMERIDPRFRELAQERMRQSSEQPRAMPYWEVTFLRADGSPLAVEVSAVPVRWMGQPGALVFVRD
jgi:PAS domain S-box-containing protein